MAHNEHEQARDLVQERLTKLWAVYHSVNEEATNLTLLAFAHHVRSVWPNAKLIHVETTDQGGDSLNCNDVTLIDGTSVQDADETDEKGLSEWDHASDELWQYAADLTGPNIDGFSFVSNTHGRRDWFNGEIDIDGVLKELDPDFKAMVDPVPDISDRKALYAWLDDQPKPEEKA